MTGTIAPDAEQDWKIESTEEQGSDIYCTVTSCFFNCQMKRKLKTKENYKDV